MLTNAYQINENENLIFFCKKCNYSCSKKNHFDRHLSTRKHKNAYFMLTNAYQNARNGPKKGASTSSKDHSDKLSQSNVEKNKEKKGHKKGHKKGPSTYSNEIVATFSKPNVDMNVVSSECPKKGINNSPPLFKCVCGNFYNHKQSLSRHKRNCSIAQDKTQLINIQNNDSSSINDKDMLTTLVSTMSKFNVDNQETLVKVLKEIIPSIGVNNSVNTNSHNNINNNFNIQMFLNEKCKNAMNLTDFIETLPITSATYDNTIENGLTKTITNMFVDGLNSMDILERPIHCTDPSRKTIYIKDNDVWEKDNNLFTIENSITRVATKQRTMINKWQDANEGWKTDEDLQTKLTSLVFNSMTLIEQDDKEKNKIIRAISKNTHLTQEIKDEYK
jgi:hypothetical protein